MIWIMPKFLILGNLQMRSLDLEVNNQTTNQ